MTKSKQGGFTLVELVVVIVILGILAAFAVPRFMGLESQARIASVSALEGTLRSASAMAHGVWLTTGSPASITIDGNTVAMTNGYPAAAALNLIVDPSVISANPGRFTFANGTFTLNGAKTPAQCKVSYTNATATAPPTILVTTSAANC